MPDQFGLKHSTAPQSAVSGKNDHILHNRELWGHISSYPFIDPCVIPDARLFCLPIYLAMVSGRARLSRLSSTCRSLLRVDGSREGPQTTSNIDQ